MSFGWDDLLGSHSSRGRLEICKKHTPDKSRRQSGAQKRVEGKKWTVAGIYRPPGYESLCRGEGSLHCGEAILHSDEACFVAADPRTDFKIVLPPKRRSKLRCGRPES